MLSWMRSQSDAQSAGYTAAQSARWTAFIHFPILIHHRNPNSHPSLELDLNPFAHLAPGAAKPEFDSRGGLC